MHSEQTSTDPQAGHTIVARAGAYYRVARFVMAALVFVMAAWFGYDGYVGYPTHNLRIASTEADREQARRDGDRDREVELSARLIDLGQPKSETDIRWQKRLGYGLPPLGLALLVWTFYNSRGTYRLQGDILQAPGHPAVPLDQILRIDKTLWDRKGIAYVDYQGPGGETRRIKLDDFVYQQAPIDAIVKRLEEHLAPSEPDDKN